MKVAVESVACRKKVGRSIMQLLGVKVNRLQIQHFSTVAVAYGQSLNKVISLVP
jgi:hypothetical protein